MSSKIEAYITRRLADGKPTGKGGIQWKAECPFCRNSESKFYANTIDGSANCFHCGVRAKDHIGLVALLERLSGRAEAERWWAEKENFLGLVGLRPRQQTLQRHMLQALPWEFRPLDGLQNAYVDYLIDVRRLTPEEITYYQIGFCETGKYGGRVIIPVINDGKLEFFTDRSIDAECPKAKRTLGIGTGKESWPVDKSTVLFNVHQASHFPTLYVVEGALDAISIGPHAIALLGKECSPVQFGRLRDAVQPGGAIVVALDVDALSYTAALCERLRIWGLDVWWLPLTYGDPNFYRQHSIPLPAPKQWDFEARLKYAPTKGPTNDDRKFVGRDRSGIGWSGGGNRRVR